MDALIAAVKHAIEKIREADQDLTDRNGLRAQLNLLVARNILLDALPDDVVLDGNAKVATIYGCASDALRELAQRGAESCGA